MSAPPYSPSVSDDDPTIARGTLESGSETDLIGPPPGRKAGIITWAALSALILIFISFGSITTRFWQLDVFQQAWIQEKASRRVFHVWMYQLDHLPYSSSPTLLKFAFGSALLVVVLGVMVSLWLILYQGNTGASADASQTPSPSTDAS